MSSVQYLQSSALQLCRSATEIGETHHSSTFIVLYSSEMELVLQASCLLERWPLLISLPSRKSITYRIRGLLHSATQLRLRAATVTSEWQSVWQMNTARLSIQTPHRSSFAKAQLIRMYVSFMIQLWKLYPIPRSLKLLASTTSRKY